MRSLGKLQWVGMGPQHLHGSSKKKKVDVIAAYVCKKEAANSLWKQIKKKSKMYYSYPVRQWGAKTGFWVEVSRLRTFVWRCSAVLKESG